jgi:hypothetical protein
MTEEREALVLDKIFSFDSDIDNESDLIAWAEQQPDADEINRLITEALGL